jgi:hypothetical protein
VIRDHASSRFGSAISDPFVIIRMPRTAASLKFYATGTNEARTATRGSFLEEASQDVRPQFRRARRTWFATSAISGVNGRTVISVIFVYQR